MAPRFNTALLPLSPDLSFELELWSKNLQIIAGIDEAGRGALAGDVAAAAVILPQNMALLQVLSGVRDSKQMTPAQREHWAVVIKREATGWGIGFASNLEIDALGIAPATRLAIIRALDALSIPPQHLLVDYIQLPECTLPQTPLVKGDARCLSIAAASVLAKTARDDLMRRYDGQYPGYGFARHKGYGTASHRLAIEQMGASSLHRKSFALLKQGIIQGGNND